MFNFIRSRVSILIVMLLILLLAGQTLMAQDDDATPEVTPEATPEATQEPDDNDNLTIKIIIEGPVEEINVNIITIWGIDIQIDPDDPILTIIQIGDDVRVEGDIAEGEGDTIIIIAITVVIVDVDVVVVDGGLVWRDSGNCSNPPPPWAPANGWRRRCERGRGGSGGS